MDHPLSHSCTAGSNPEHLLSNRRENLHALKQRNSQLSSHHANNKEHCSLSCNETLTLSWALAIILIIPAVKPASKGSSQILMSLNSKNQRHNFTVRLKVLQVLDSAGQSCEGSKSCFTQEVAKWPTPPEVPLQLMVLWVCGWGCEQLEKEKSRLLLLKNCTEVKLKEGNSRSSEQQEVTELQQILQINTGDKKAKNEREKTLFPNPKWTNWGSYSTDSYKGKLGVKETPCPKLSYHSYFKQHLLSLVMLRVSKQSPSSSSADMNRCTGMEELQWGAHGPAPSKCMAVPPFPASTNELGKTWEL